MRWPGRARTPVEPGADSDAAFAALVTGRRVAVVGPATTLTGSGSGEQIDAFDLVVRFNESFELLPHSGDLGRDIGRRCDIVYANQVVLRRHLTERGTRERRRTLTASRECGLKYLVCTNNSLSYGPDGRPQASCPPVDRHTPAAVHESLRRDDGRVRFRVSHQASLRAMTLLDGCFGRTGFIAILDLLGSSVSELFVTGMSFYHGGGHLLAPTGPPLHPRGNRDGTPATDASGQGHDSERELAVFRWLINDCNSTLRVDEPLAKLLHYGPDLAERSRPH